MVQLSKFITNRLKQMDKFEKVTREVNTDVTEGPSLQSKKKTLKVLRSGIRSEYFEKRCFSPVEFELFAIIHQSGKERLSSFHLH